MSEKDSPPAHSLQHRSSTSPRSRPGVFADNDASTARSAGGSHVVQASGPQLPITSEYQHQQLSRTSSMGTMIHPHEHRRALPDLHLPSLSGGPRYGVPMNLPSPYGPGASTPRPTLPSASSLPGTPIGSGRPMWEEAPLRNRQSPSILPHPLHDPLHDQRQIEDAMRSRAVSVGGPLGLSGFGPRASPQDVAPLSPTKRVYNLGAAEQPRPPPHPPLHSLTTMSPLTTPPREFSQLSQPSALGQAMPASHQHPGMSPARPSSPATGRESRDPRPRGAVSAYAHPPSPTRSYAASATGSEASSNWAEPRSRARSSRAMAGVGSQAAIMNIPGSEPIHIEVDFQQASRQASEKRHRNAQASGRHRAKKRTLHEENARALQDLKDERRRMAQDVQQLVRQRDFYHGERDRLREVIARTQGVPSDMVRLPSPRPVSPDRLAAYESLAHAMPDAQGLSPPGPESDESAAERPAQRRRLGDASGFPVPEDESYSMVPAPALPPMVTSAPSLPPPRPTSASSTASAAENSSSILRAEGGQPLHSGEGAGTGSAPRGMHEQDPRTGQWMPFQPRQIDPGWATRKGA